MRELKRVLETEKYEVKPEMNPQVLPLPWENANQTVNEAIRT